MAGSVLSEDLAFCPSVLIPVYNHEDAISITLRKVLQYNYPVLLIDDGSQRSCHEVLVSLSEQHASVTLLTLPENGGKGAAVKAGLHELQKNGYSHAIQLDADGQHDIADLPKFVESARANLESLITGYPEYDESVPRIRHYGRYLTHIWVWINTLSFEIRDSMCGFRIYPVSAVVQLIDQEKCGQRMDFDPEVIVRWKWRGGRIVNLPTKVSYPIDGVSHFDVWHDNVLITLMHTRLFFGMLPRLPNLLWQKLHG